jgi:hypothetical protein
MTDMPETTTTTTPTTGAEEPARDPGTDRVPAASDTQPHPVPKPGQQSATAKGPERKKATKAASSSARKAAKKGGTTMPTATAEKLDKVEFPIAKGGKTATLTAAQVRALASKDPATLHFGFGAEYVEVIRVDGKAFQVKDAVRQALGKDLPDLRQDVSVRTLERLGFKIAKVNKPAKKGK